MRYFFLVIIVIAGFIYGGLWLSKNQGFHGDRYKPTMQISSSAFVNNASIPTNFTCSGLNINPPLTFSKIPTEARSLALILDDPDAPNGTFTHWVVYNISPSTTSVAQGVNPNGVVASNSAGTRNYVGPCPPSGEHRYHFKLYALDLVFRDGEFANKGQLEEAMRGHVIDQAELIGRFQKP